jgi:hypothetical protein
MPQIKAKMALPKGWVVIGSRKQAIKMLGCGHELSYPVSESRFQKEAVIVDTSTNLLEETGKIKAGVIYLKKDYPQLYSVI